MYPNLKESDLTLYKLSLQQSEVFKRYYGVFGFEPQETSAIQDELGIYSHNQVAVQLNRAEVKLGCDKDERLKLTKDFKKAYYKEYRPKCPFCRASKARFRGLKDSDINWQCGKCHRSFMTPHTNIRDSRVDISFVMLQDGTAKDVRVSVNGTKQAASGKIELAVGDENWFVELKNEQAKGRFAGLENGTQPLML